MQVDQIVEISKKSDTDSKAYDDLTKDGDLVSALATYNQTAKMKLKLGPSGAFADDLAFARKCQAEVATETVPVSTIHSVPEVEVALNGKTKVTMVWDSGASSVVLSAKLAEELGMVPSENNPIVRAQIADGSIITAHKMTLKSIKVGIFTVNDVECTVMPANLKNAPALLGDTFQSHFLVKLDQNAGKLHLTPVDTTIAAKTAGAKAKPGVPTSADKD